MNREKMRLFIFGLLFVMLACSLSTPLGDISDTGPNPTETGQNATDRPAASETPLPTNEPTPLRPGIAIIGQEEIVFDWTFDACGYEDIPDLPARAFRDANGVVHLLSSHLETREHTGPNLNEVTHSCNVLKSSDHDPDPAMYNDSEWIAGIYTEDGQSVYAITHNEYHGWEHGVCSSPENFDCWYNALTLSKSEDGGQSFVDAAPAPDHFVVGLPYPYEDGAGPYGVMEPSNILKVDGNYYMMVRIDDYQSDEQRVCLLRTNNLAAPESWRAWDGSDFTIAMPDPYRYPDAETTRCEHPSRDQIGVMNISLTYNTFLERFVLLGISADTIAGRETWGVYYSFSDDLVNWTHRELLWEVELPWTYEIGDENYILYPTLIDPESLSLSFETTGKTAYLYFTRFNFMGGFTALDRDLVRVPVEFFEDIEEAVAGDSRTVLSAQAFDRADGTIEFTGNLGSSAGVPLAGAAIEFFDSALTGSGDYEEYVIEGLVPEGVTRAMIGYRINTECNCSGESDFVLYEMRYSEDDDLTNRVPDPRLSLGLGSAGLWGEGYAQLEPSDRDDGQMLHVAADAGQVAAGNLVEIPVNPGSRFKMVFAVRAAPLSTGSGFLSLMFFDSPYRMNAWFAPAEVSIGTVITDDQGDFSLTMSLDATSNVRVMFAGEGAYQPSRQTILVER